MSLQPFWQLGGLRSVLTSATSRLRTFSTSHEAKRLSSDPVKRRSQMDRENQLRRIKYETDPEFRDRKRKWHKGNREDTLEYYRKEAKKHYLQDPVFRPRKMVYAAVKRDTCLMQSLPWKSHVPVLYEQRVQHSCDKCVATRFGGFKLWWKQRQSTDDKQIVDSQKQQGPEDEKYRCHTCYFTGPEVMPEGHEDVKGVTDVRERKKELGHWS